MYSYIIRIFNDDSGKDEPLSGGLVIRNNRTATRTDSDGKFSITVDADVDRLVLTFVDPGGNYMTTTKVIHINIKCLLESFLQAKCFKIHFATKVSKTLSRILYFTSISKIGSYNFFLE